MTLLPAWALASLLLPLLIAASAAQAPTSITIRPLVATAPVPQDADDPAIWVHPSNRARSLILGTNKVKADEGGALYVFGLDGKVRQIISGLDRPNNVDVEKGLLLDGKRVDIAVTTERLKSRLRVFRIPSDGGKLSEVGSGLPVFTGQSGEQAAPMGIALYRRSRDGALFAIVGRKTGPRRGYLWQYRLQDNGRGGIRAVKVREFGRFSGKGEIEAIAVDDTLGYVYYADEADGIHKWRADPDHRHAAQELAVFGREGFTGDREGIGIYTRANGTGYIVCTDQIRGGSQYHIYRREGERDRPHDHSRLVSVLQGGADETDGIEVLSTPLGSRFPNGLLIAMNSGPRNFLVYRWPQRLVLGKPVPR